MSAEKAGDANFSLKQKFMEQIKRPNFIKTFVIIICTAIVIKQITKCVQKQFIDIPVTTHTHFDFNKTILYPSVTVCREPPYKFHKLLATEQNSSDERQDVNVSIIEYGLKRHPRFTSTWIYYNFSKVTLDELWKKVTYDTEDFFFHYSLNGDMANVELKPYIGFVMGRCYTLSPKILSTQATKASGYSITLRYNEADIAASNSSYRPGYHIYVHYTREPFTEVQVYDGGLIDQHYVKIGERVEIKLNVDEYIMVSSDNDPCSHKVNYSENSCTAQYAWDKVGNIAGCSGPWMTSDLPRCDNYTSMRSLIVAYMNEYSKHDVVNCPRFCRTFLYSGYVTDRQTLYFWDSTENKHGGNNSSTLQIQLYLYFNSMMVTVYEKRYNHDLHRFISDIGSSIGFLLGLSIIGLVDIMCKAWILFVQPYITPKLKDNNPPRTQLI